MSEDSNDKIQFDAMPGADTIEQAENLDMNFGLGEEPAEVEAEAAPEVEADSDAEVEAETEVEAEAEAEAEAETEVEAEAEEQPALDDEPEVAQDEAEPAEAPAKKQMVPKSRLDEVLAKQKALQKQLDDMKAAQTLAEEAPSEYDFAEKEVEYQNLVLDGESQKAAALRAEIRAAERTQLEYEMTQKMTKTVSENQQLTALQQAASELEASFPVFDQGSSDYNAEYTQEVIELRDAFILKGENAVAALSKAAKFVVREYGLDNEVAPSLSTKPTKTIDEVAKKRAEVSKKLKAADAQPPELPGESSANRGERPLDVSNMTEDEFNALPEATLRRLRGDVV
jgi:hypothetical protein